MIKQISAAASSKFEFIMFNNFISTLVNIKNLKQIVKNAGN
jgi:hypothetical protein